MAGGGGGGCGDGGGVGGGDGEGGSSGSRDYSSADSRVVILRHEIQFQTILINCLKKS